MARSNVKTILLAVIALFAGMGSPALVQAKDLLDRVPNAAQIVEAVPRRALRAGVRGDVSLQCTVRADGQFEKCEVESEKPEGSGFGEAALKLVPFFRVNMSDPRAKGLTGARVRQAIGFPIDEAPAAPAKPAAQAAKPVPPLCPSKKDCMEVN